MMNDNVSGGGPMSQEEIDKMLSSLSGIDDSAHEENTGNGMTPEDIEKMLSSANMIDNVFPPHGFDYNVDNYLTDEAKDLLGEVGNICMGASAKALNQLLSRSTDITIPKVSIFPGYDIASRLKGPLVSVEIEYTQGVTGSNLLLLKEHDALLITDIMMGGEGVVEDGAEIDEMGLSAISEAMNQMVGQSSIAMGEMLNRLIDISTPKAKVVRTTEEFLSHLPQNSDILVEISFNMKIEGLLESDIMQIMPLTFAKEMVERLMNPPEEPSPAPPPPQAAPVSAPQQGYAPPQQEYVPPQQGYAPPQQGYAPPQQGYYPPQPQAAPRPQYDAQPVQFPSFDTPHMMEIPPNIERIIDVPLQVSVELGRTTKTVEEILKYQTGDVVALERLAGDYVDINVNGKLIARGEVVVIDENFGVRITEVLPTITQAIFKK